MSITGNKVRLEQKTTKKLTWWVIGGIEGVLTLVLVVTLALSRLFSFEAESAAGVVTKLAYQGRLTDTSGNPLGGSGANYCMRFAIYDASTGGSKLWPSGTPATTTVSVINGVFNAEIGSADTLTYNFYDNDTVYLDVAINTVTSTCTGSYESLSPRQQILATGFAITAKNVYGDLLKTDNASSIVRIGSGAGVATSSLKYLALDVANVAEVVGGTCTVPGTIWYNSNASNTQVLVCENGGTIKAVADRQLSLYESQRGVGLGANAIANGTLSFQRIYVPHYVKATRLDYIMHITGSSSGAASVSVVAGLYTMTGSTARLASSASRGFSFNSTSASSYTRFSGTRYRSVDLNGTWNITPGDYLLGFVIATTSASTNATITIYGHSSLSIQANEGTGGNYSYYFGNGLYSAATSSMPTSLHLTQINQTGASVNRQPYVRLIGTF